MIKEQTVFILGAGASCPYGYPSGIELRKQICTSFVSDVQSYFSDKNNLTLTSIVNQAEGFVDKFRKSGTSSIDLFLARNTEFMDMGKCAITFRIFAAESKSRFREDMEDRSQDWYSYMFSKLADELVKKDDYCHFCENNVSFITFNYDRSLEHFLYENLFNSFNNIGAEKIKEQLTKIKIIHVFGQVVGLKWQDMVNGIDYRTPINQIIVQKLAKNLKIIYEEQNNPELVKAKKLINEAKRIFFLGFGYAKENMEVLDVPRIISPNTKVYGTALGFTNKEILTLINTFIQGTVPDEILGRNAARFTEGFRNLDCLGLLRESL